MTMTHTQTQPFMVKDGAHLVTPQQSQKLVTAPIDVTVKP